MAVITFNDGAAATLRNVYPAPGDRFANWTPITRPFGDSVPRLSDAALTMFRQRTDYGASFDLPGLSVRNAAPPRLLSISASPTGGTLPAGTYYYVMTAVLPNGETGPSNELSVVTTGATSSVSVAGSPVGGAIVHRLYRGMAPGAESLFYASVVSTFLDTNSGGTVTPPPTSGVNLVAIADRLVAHLLGGGTCSVATEDALGSTYATCGLWPGTMPSVRLTDRRTLLYALSLQLVNLAGSPVRMDCVYV